MNTRQHGMALIVVLWLIVLLGIMAAGHARNAHTDTRLASRQVEVAKARGIAEAGINHIILRMLGKESQNDLPVDGTVFATQIRGDVVTMAIRDATGLVDLNAANAGLLEATLRASDVAKAQRSKLVDAILDWRDRDDLAHLNGFEDEAYAATGVPWTARDAAFRAIDELKYLPGMSQSLYERLAPLVTVHSRRASINLEFAPPAMIVALTGDRIEPATQDVESAGTRQQQRGPRNGTYHIYASVAADSGAVASVEVVVRISRSSERPFTILEWREPPRSPLPPQTGVRG